MLESNETKWFLNFGWSSVVFLASCGKTSSEKLRETHRNSEMIVWLSNFDRHSCGDAKKRMHFIRKKLHVPKGNFVHKFVERVQCLYFDHKNNGSIGVIIRSSSNYWRFSIKTEIIHTHAHLLVPPNWSVYLIPIALNISRTGNSIESMIGVFDDDDGRTF